MDKFLEQAKKVVSKREFGMGLTAVYYAGGTLCLDIYSKGVLRYLLMVNISGESYTICDSGDSSEVKGLLDVKSLKLAFDLYQSVKGVTNYYDKCFDKSCLRHIMRKPMLDVSEGVKGVGVN